MPWWNPFAREVREDLVEAQAGPAARPPARRQGYEYGISQQGLSEYNQGTALSGNDRRALMTQLYEAFLACPWSWASVNAIARRVTAGALILEWDPQDGSDVQEPTTKPANVLAFEQLLAYCNPRENIRQLIRGIVSDLLVFGDAFVEVVWIGKQPVALHSLDAPSMFPVADEHGVITGYVQITESYQRAEFEPREVIHISLDAPRSGVFGVSPTYAALLPITSWLFTAATLKEIYRKGNPPNIHVDLPGSADADVWLDQYMARNVGSRNIGRPIVTKNGGKVAELQRNGIPELLDVLAQRRDEIVSAYGVPPAQVGIIESGNLGGGTGESQQKSFELITCDPIAALILEALFFHLGVQGFGIEGWKLGFTEVDLRDSDTVEGIREKRLQNGVWTVNRYRADVGEPTVEGGDDAVLMGAATSNLVRVTDLDASAKAQIAKAVVGTELSIGDPGETGDSVELVKAPKPDPAAGPPGFPGPDGGPGGPGGPGGGPVPQTGPQGGGAAKDTRDTDDDPDSFGKDDEEEDPEETGAGDTLDESLVDALAAEQVARYVDTTGALWAWSDVAGTYERHLTPELTESLLEVGASAFLDEHDVMWLWSVEETKYVRTAKGSAHFGLPIGAPIVAGAGTPAKKSGGKIAFASKQKTQKATAAHFFGGGGHGATWNPSTSTLDVTDPAAAGKHLDNGLKNHSSATPVPKVAISAMKKKVAALDAGDNSSSAGDGPDLSPAGTPVNTQPGKLEDFAAIPDVDVNEPPLPQLAPGKRMSTGIIVREPDGRIWILEPKGHYGGYEHTFPKGGMEDDGLSPQQNAHKELFEELGLKAKITGYVGDYKGSTGVTRMYVADRTGGTPHPDDPTPYVPGGLEAAAIKLVTPGQAEQMLNTKRDKQMLADLLAMPASSTDTPSVTPGGPIKTADWERVGKQKGSNPGGTFAAPNGGRYYVKQSKSDKHARNEVLAANLYKLAGIDHADLQLADVGDGKLGTASKILDGAKPNMAEKLGDPQYKSEAQRGFAVDAWLANWDVAGATLDNIVTDASGKPVRIDPGGSLLFRAQGTPKGAAFGNDVGEWDSLRSPSVNAQSAKLFGGMTPAQLKASAQRVVDVTPAQIDKAIADAGFKGADAKLLSERLKARRADVAKRAGLELPEGGSAATVAPATKPDVTPATPAAPAPQPTVVSKAEAADALGLSGEDGYYAIDNLKTEADASGYPMALAPNADGSIEEYPDLPDIPVGTANVVVATPSGTLTHHPVWQGQGPPGSSPAPSVAPSAPSAASPGTPGAAASPGAPTAPKAAVGVVGFQSGQNKQKQLAAQVFGPGTSNGASWDGKSKLTVTDPQKAAAALDDTLAGGSTPGQKMTVKAVKGKVTALAAASPPAGATSSPATPTPSVTPAPSGGLTPAAAAAQAAQAGIPVTADSIKLFQNAYSGGGYLVPSSATSGYSSMPLSMTPAEGKPYLQLDSAGVLTFHPGSNGASTGASGPPMSTATKVINTEMADKIGVDTAELAALRAGALGVKSHYATKGPDGKLVKHTSSDSAKATGLPYVQVDKNGNYSFHSAGSSNSSTQPKGAQHKPAVTPSSSGGWNSFAGHEPIPSDTPYVGMPDGETSAQRQARIAAEKAAADQYALDYRKSLKAAGGLTEGERAAIKSYGASGYMSINSGLRHPPPSASAAAKIKQINAAMLKVPNPEPRTVWRGTGGWAPPMGLKAGDTFTDPGFVSTSLASSSAFGGTRLEISLPAGFPVVSINGALTKSGAPHGNELELLLPHGTEFAVVSDEIKGGQRWMKVEAIPPAHLLEQMTAA